MRVLLFTLGFTQQPSLKNTVRKHLPTLTGVVKSKALLYPSSVQRQLLSGYSRERRLPAGLGLLSAILKQQGHKVELADRLVDGDFWPDDVPEYDFVGIHTTTPCFQDGLDVLDRLRDMGFRGRIAMGGPHTSLYPETIPPSVNYIVQGEAEFIINGLAEGAFPDNCIIITPRIQQLDGLPQIDYSLFFDRKRAYELNVPFFPGDRVFNITTSRSCPFRCTFCATKDIWGRLWTSYSAARIVDDIEYLRDAYGVDGLYFREDLFTANVARVYEICGQLRSRQIDLPWAVETRARDVCDVELVRTMAAAGCKGFYIGAESGSQRMLDRYVKDARIEHTMAALKIARNNGIKTAVSMIVGNPEEQYSDKVASYKMIKSTQPDVLQTSVFNGRHTGRNCTDFPQYDLNQRRTIRFTHEGGTWKGQEDRNMPIAIVS